MPRITAAIVAIICWAGLAIQFAATYSGVHDVVATLWLMLRYFTVTTNLALAVIMTWIATGGRVSAELLGGVTIAIILVGVIVVLLLRGLLELSGGALLADILLHQVSPIAMAVWWLLFAPRGKLGWKAPAAWAIYPMAYFAYALVRGHYEGRYAYPFMNVDKLGWTQTLINAGGIALGFMIAGELLVLIDRWRPLGSRAGRR